MTKEELATAMAERTNLSKYDCLTAIDEMILLINNALRKKDDITLRGFGTFAIVRRKEKYCRDIRKGKGMITPAHDAVKFRPCEKLKKMVANG